MTRRTLDRAAVVQEAAQLADRNGFESLNLAELAARVGVKPPSLYNHIKGLDDLRRQLQIVALEEFTRVASQAAMGRAGRDAMQSMARALRAWARSRPGLWTALQPAPAPDDPEMAAAAAKAMEPFEAVLAPLFLPQDEVIHMMRTFRSLIHGFAGLEARGGFGLPTDLDTSFDWALEAILPID